MTITTQKDVPYLKYLIRADAKHRFISFEPLLGQIRIALNGVDWIIIGQQTKPSIIPKRYWVKLLLDEADRLRIPAFIKPPLQYYVERKEIPEVM